MNDVIRVWIYVPAVGPCLRASCRSMVVCNIIPNEPHHCLGSNGCTGAQALKAVHTGSGSVVKDESDTELL